MASNDILALFILEMVLIKCRRLTDLFLYSYEADFVQHEYYISEGT